MINLEEIDVLVFAENNCHAKIISVEKARKDYPKFSIDLENGEWSPNREKTYKIGKGRLFHSKNKYGYGIIGVYNSAEKRQRNSMIHATTDVMKFFWIWHRPD